MTTTIYQAAVQVLQDVQARLADPGDRENAERLASNLGSVLSLLPPFSSWSSRFIRFGLTGTGFVGGSMPGIWAIARLLEGNDPKVLISDAAALINSDRAEFSDVYLLKGIEVHDILCE